MRIPRRWFGGQKGQAMVVVAVGLVILLGMVGLVVDVGNAYALQRKVRNAVDASALAAAREMARGWNVTTNGEVLAKAREYAVRNALPAESIVVWYGDIDGTPLALVNYDGAHPAEQINGVDVAGVVVQGHGTVRTYLAHLFGVSSFSAGETSVGLWLCGVCSAQELFPATAPASVLMAYGKPIPGAHYRFIADQVAPGNWGWVAWDDGPGHTSNAALVANLQAIVNGSDSSGEWAITDEEVLPGGPGVMNSADVRAALEALVGRLVTIPVYDHVTGTGANVRYDIAGFVSMRLTGFDMQCNPKYFEGVVENDTQPQAEAGCADLGVCVVKLRRPLTEIRSIGGVVALWEPELSERLVPATLHIPVDVVNVLDISGSMNDSWGPGEDVKLVTAKSVLTEFNGYLLPEDGDQAALVTFPRRVSSSAYSMECASGTHRYKYFAQVRSALTDDIDSINSIIASLSANYGTPIADAMQQARGVALPTGTLTEGRVPVLILASDGLTNIKVDGKFTGFPGSVYDSPSCNDLAVQQAVEQANAAKQAGIVIFTIAIGDNFNTDLLQAMATEDTDPSKPHFFSAATQEELQAAYRSIAERVVDIGAECEVKESETPGGGAEITLYRDGVVYAQTQASSSGSFVFTPVDPGEYSFSVSLVKNGLTFDVLTETIGGPAAAAPITIVAGEGNGTYVRDLYARTSTPLLCVP